MANAVFKLEDSDFTHDQVEALTEFMSSSVATKEDIARLEGKVAAQGERFGGRIIGLEGKINLAYWMLGILIAGVSSLVINTFFGRFLQNNTLSR